MALVVLIDPARPRRPSRRGALQTSTRRSSSESRASARGRCRASSRSGPDRGAKLTTARYFTPSVRSIHRAAKDTGPDDSPLEDDRREAEPPAPADTARPLFRTASGRPVYGGGGVTPDVIVESDSLPPLARTVESRGLAFRFASRWLEAHPMTLERV